MSEGAAIKGQEPILPRPDKDTEKIISGVSAIISLLDNFGDMIGGASAFDHAFRDKPIRYFRELFSRESFVYTPKLPAAVPLPHIPADQIELLMEIEKKAGDVLETFGEVRGAGMLSTAAESVAQRLGGQAKVETLARLRMAEDQLSALLSNKYLNTAFTTLGYLALGFSMYEYAVDPDPEKAVSVGVNLGGILIALLPNAGPLVMFPAGYAFGEQAIAFIKALTGFDTHDAVAEMFIEDEFETNVLLFGAHGPDSMMRTIYNELQNHETALVFDMEKDGAANIVIANELNSPLLYTGANQVERDTQNTGANNSRAFNMEDHAATKAETGPNSPHTYSGANQVERDTQNTGANNNLLTPTENRTTSAI